MRKIIATVSTVGALALASTSANAAIIDGSATNLLGSASFVELSPTAGFTVGKNNQQSNTLFAFNEQQGVKLTDSIGGIAAGTLVNSHYVFYDPAGLNVLFGNVTFDSEVLGILTTRSALSATDALLGLSDVNYLNPWNRGLEFLDYAGFSGNSAHFAFSAGSPGDYVRVLTAATPAVPEPATWAMMLLGFGAIGGAMRARRRDKVSVAYA